MQLEFFIIKIEGLANKVCADFFSCERYAAGYCLGPRRDVDCIGCRAVRQRLSGSFPKFPYHLNFLKCRHQSPISLTLAFFLGRWASPHNIFMQIAPNLMWLLSNFDNEIKFLFFGSIVRGLCPYGQS